MNLLINAVQAIEKEGRFTRQDVARGSLDLRLRVRYGLRHAS